MPTRAETNAKAATLRARFEAAGAVVVEPPLLQPADTLLDLYGEDIRGRAYVTSDALRGEQMLRPDFTVPVVQMHMADGAEPARYTYSGEVFRRQDDHPGRASEYVQVGYEIFDREDPAAADAEVYSLISDAVASLGVRGITGDIGILADAVRGLNTTDRRKAALTRHIWRPKRFHALLDRFSGQTPASQERTALLAQDEPVPYSLTFTGKRTPGEVEARIAALREDAQAPLLSLEEVALITRLLGVQAKYTVALTALHEMALHLPSIVPALDRMVARADALSRRGIDVADLDFDAGHGRTSMEYYDGFVFSFARDNAPHLPAIATGGRYDALARRLGQGQEIPAVGAVLRPGLMLDLEAGQ